MAGMMWRNKLPSLGRRSVCCLEPTAHVSARGQCLSFSASNFGRSVPFSQESRLLSFPRCIHIRSTSSTSEQKQSSDCVAPPREQASCSAQGACDKSASSVSPHRASASAAAGIACGIGSFLAFDAGVKTAMLHTGLALYLPTQIGGMLASFSTLSALALLNKPAAEKLHALLMPSVGFINRWLPVFLCPVQVMLPTIHLPGGSPEVAALLAFLGSSWLLSIGFAAKLTSGILSLSSTGATAATGASAGSPLRLPATIPAFWLAVACAAFGAGTWLPDKNAEASEKETLLLDGKSARGICLAALGAAGFGVGLWRGLPGHISFLYCGGFTISGGGLLALVRGESFEQVVRRDYIAPDGKGAGDRLLWFLGPALVATGVQIFQYRQRIQQYGAILMASCAASSLVNILSTAALAPAMGVSLSATLAGTVRCVTVPMGLPCYEQLCSAQGLDFNIGLLALCAGISGFLGFAVGKSLLTRMGYSLDQAIVRGIAIGSSSHVLGSATLAGAETEAFAWGMLATAVSGVCSAFWLCGCPPVMQLTTTLASRCTLSSKEGEDV
mmetsp:Transcript_60189/g.135453  ORF Transcript_60189/g.135453 Transcript_60189/m.135453 type:complete len:557 (+) Transcript_60189:20-1690(+)